MFYCSFFMYSPCMFRNCMMTSLYHWAFTYIAIFQDGGQFSNKRPLFSIEMESNNQLWWSKTSKLSFISSTSVDSAKKAIFVPKLAAILENGDISNCPWMTGGHHSVFTKIGQNNEESDKKHCMNTKTGLGPFLLFGCQTTLFLLWS